MSNFFQGYNTDNDLILNTASQLLEPFRQAYPEAIEEALTVIRSGQPVEGAGRVMLESIQTLLAQSKQEGAEKQESLQKTIDEITDFNHENELEIVELRSDLEVIQNELKFIVDETEGYKQTIATQNTLLARQQRKLQKLLCNTQEDE